MATKIIPIDGAFAKGLIDSNGENKVGANFAVYCRNQRVVNGATTVKKGFRTLISDSSGTHIRAITYNTLNSKILCASDSKLKLVDLTSSVLTDIGSIGTDTNVSMFNHGKYTIILTGIGKGYVYDGTTLTQLTTTVPDENCLIGVAFSGFTIIVGNKEATSNWIYFSRPVTPTNPEYAYDWVGSGSEKKNMQSKVLGMIASLNNLYVFTKNTIEYVGKDSLSSLGGTFSFYSSPIGEGDELLNRNCVVSANDKIFYMTSNFSIKALNYVQGNVDPQIGRLSDREMLSIKSFLDNNLNSDQSDAFAIRKEDKIYWYLRSINSAINDIALVYDITNDNWYVDDSIYYSCMVKANNNYYAGSYLNSDIIQDDYGYDLDSQGIPFDYLTPPLNFGNTTARKFFKGWIMSGNINKDTVLQVDTIVDTFTVASEKIYGSDYTSTLASEGIGGSEIGGASIGGTELDTTGGFVPFDKVSKGGQINVKGKKIQLRIRSEEPNAQFHLDYLAFMVRPVGNYELGDVL